MSLAVILSIVVAAGVFAIATTIPSGDPDTYWHLASGRWMLQHGELIRSDSFSSTARDVPYSVGEWLGQLVWYSAYAFGGWQGLSVLRALIVAVAAYFATHATLLAQPRPLHALAPLLAALVISKTIWTDRPQLFTLALFAVFFFVLLRAHLGLGSRALWVLPVLTLVWTNLHGGYALGLALITLFLLAALTERSSQDHVAQGASGGVGWRRRLARSLAAVLVLAAGASTLNPESFGAAGALGHAVAPLRFIAEWLPPDVFSPQGLVFAMLFLTALASAIVAGSSHRMWPIVLVPLIWLGLSGQRHLPLAAIPLAVFVAEAGPRAAARLWPGLRLPEPRHPRVSAARGALIVLFVVAASLVPAGAAASAPDESAYPSGALAALRSAPRELLNEYDWGGYLIWNAPEHPVFIDGRLMHYLPNVLADYRTATELRPPFLEVLERRRIQVVLLAPGRALSVFLRESGWRVAAEEPGRFVLLVRP